ncbi:hypothetical protein PCANC_00687 [Puccinia coronata f. sp. avenae]|uniref:Uncharacterized protein n=1 Tax=Puccinia coronata f. sp. avenae TaxID=200324 RepID=A0A2N5W749_9BASI|nr:hypothetical protein PCANC_00687 [Puccinia coronata f. sp. avenae]
MWSLWRLASLGILSGVISSEIRVPVDNGPAELPETPYRYSRIPGSANHPPGGHHLTLVHPRTTRVHKTESSLQILSTTRISSSPTANMSSSENQRLALVRNAFSRSITNVSKPVDAQTLAEAFPYATPQMLDSLAEQTKTAFSHYANGRWAEFAQAASFEELCNQFDRLEREAMERFQAGAEPVIITRDPKLSIPPLLLKTLNNLETLYQSANQFQLQTNENLHTQIKKQIKEIERLEADIKNRVGQIQSTAEEWQKVSPRGQS